MDIFVDSSRVAGCVGGNDNDDHLRCVMRRISEVTFSWISFLFRLSAHPRWTVNSLFPYCQRFNLNQILQRYEGLEQVSPHNQVRSLTTSDEEENDTEADGNVDFYEYDNNYNYYQKDEELEDEIILTKTKKAASSDNNER